MHLSLKAATRSSDAARRQRRSQRSIRADDVGPSTDAGPAATAQGGPAATAQGGLAATARVPSTPSVIEVAYSMQILYEESQRRLHQTQGELRLAHVKIDILEDRSPRTGRKRDHTNTEREREPKIRKELEEDAKMEHEIPNGLWIGF